MTPAEVRTLVAEAPVPDGWRLDLRVERSYAHRNLWSLTSVHRGIGVRRWVGYDIAGLLPVVLDSMSTGACSLCHRDHGGNYVRVSWPDGSVRDVCDICMEKADEGRPHDETLTYEEGEG